MNFKQEEISNNFWNNYQLFINDRLFNNNTFSNSKLFYDFQDYINAQNSILVYPILDYYIDYAQQHDYNLIVYLLYSPFLWESSAYRYQLSKLLHYIKTNQEIANYILKEEFDDYFLGLMFNKSSHLGITHGSINSLNMWFYLGAYNLITDHLSLEMSTNLDENIIPTLVESYYNDANISVDASTDWFTVLDEFSKLAYNIYEISVNKTFKTDYVKDFLYELNQFMKSLYANAPSIYQYLDNVRRMHEKSNIIDPLTYEFYKDLFIKHGYNISDNLLPGILLLAQKFEDVIDFYLANIPFIYRNKSGYVQLSIEEYLKIFHCLFGVGTNELYTISNY